MKLISKVNYYITNDNNNKINTININNNTSNNNL